MVAKLALVDAVQPQPTGATTLTLPVPPFVPNDWPLELSEYVQVTLPLRTKKTKVADAVKPMRALAKSAAGTKVGARAEQLAKDLEAAARRR